MSIKHTIKTIQEFIRLESLSGILLISFAILALIVANSPLQDDYNALLSKPFAIHAGPFTLADTLVGWINEGLMAIFFLLIGLEIKREILIGELNTLQKITLPGFAALGGMLLPAFFYIALNYQDSHTIHGWAVPVATDIAFSLGILSLLNGRIPATLKVFLTALAILDDLGAILIIAIFYTAQLSWLSLGLATICLVLLFGLNKLKVMSLWPYFLMGIILWICVMESGVHATLAGVALAMAIPLRHSHRVKISPLRELETKLHPWVAFFVLPIFAFFNAGVSLKGVSLQTFMETIPLGIILGLFFGKQIGVFSASFIAVKLNWAKLPKDLDWLWLYGISLICGIGFTMSLFIGSLAFGLADVHSATNVRLGVLIGSLCSGVIGCVVLLLIGRKRSVQPSNL